MSKSKTRKRSKSAETNKSQRGGGRRSSFLTVDRVIIGGIAIFIVGAIIVLALQSSSSSDLIADPDTPDNSVSYPIISREHIPNNQPHDPYNSNPPTSGPHYTSPARADVYDQVIQDEILIHNLEHGHVWFSYSDPDDQEAIDLLDEIQGSASREIIVTYRPNTPARVSAAAWGRLLLVEDALDAEELRAFALRYRNRAPEQIPG